MRNDLNLIRQWIKPASHVLDLGCGDGELLQQLQQTAQVSGYGLEIDPKKIITAISRGVNCIQQDLNQDLTHIADNSFDYVIMAQSLQQLKHPHRMLAEMLRVADEAIVTFPNFGYWPTRFYLTLKGKMPVSKTLPYQWFDTPNIHLCTFKDFERLCEQLNIKVKQRLVVDHRFEQNLSHKLLPNLLGEFAIYHLER